MAAAAWGRVGSVPPAQGGEQLQVLSHPILSSCPSSSGLSHTLRAPGAPGGRGHMREEAEAMEGWGCWEVGCAHGHGLGRGRWTGPAGCGEREGWPGVGGWEVGTAARAPSRTVLLGATGARGAWGASLGSPWMGIPWDQPLLS